MEARIADRFGFSRTGLWWWEAVPRDAKVVRHGYTNDGLELLLSIIPGGAEALYLFVTDDAAPPWRCVCGTASDLVAMLRELPFFEFFIVDRGTNWIVFDTHHNVIVTVGEVSAASRAWMQAVIEVFVTFGRAHGSGMSSEETGAFIEDLLFGKRKLWAAYEVGIILASELVNALLGRFSVAAFGAGAGPDDALWERCRVAVRSAMFAHEA